MTIRISGLVPLLDGTGYKLVGGTTEHSDNHYGIASVVKALQDVATDYQAKHSTQVLKYNDMSLVFGGLFDAYNPNNNPNTEWKNPHLSYGCGVDINIGIRAVDNTLINKPDLAKALNDNYA